jgi:hypothetical protein
MKFIFFLFLFWQQRKLAEFASQNALLIDGFNLTYARSSVLSKDHVLHSMSSPVVPPSISQGSVPIAVAAAPRAVAAPHATFSVSTLAETYISSARSNLGLAQISKDVHREKSRDQDLFEGVSQEQRTTVY